jgi:hypothetical protein
MIRLKGVLDDQAIPQEGENLSRSLGEIGMGGPF